MQMATGKLQIESGKFTVAVGSKGNLLIFGDTEGDLAITGVTAAGINLSGVEVGGDIVITGVSAKR